MKVELGNVGVIVLEPGNLERLKGLGKIHAFFQLSKERVFIAYVPDLAWVEQEVGKRGLDSLDDLIGILKQAEGRPEVLR